MTDTVAPPVFTCLSWHTYFTRPLAGDVGEMLGALAAVGGGSPPKTLESEEAIRVFSAHLGIKLCDADLEEVLVWPNEAFARRDWVRDCYARFLAWCVENGWLEGAEYDPADRPEVTPESPPEPKKKRQRQPVAA